MLVLYLQNSRKSEADESHHYSFLAIKIYYNTFVNRQSCDCRKEERQCLDSSVEHRLGTVERSRYSMSTDLDAWNVANLGQWQQSSLGNHKIERSLERVQLICKTPKDRMNLAGSVFKCKGSDSKASDYCNKHHRGTFSRLFRGRNVYSMTADVDLCQTSIKSPFLEQFYRRNATAKKAQKYQALYPMPQSASNDDKAARSTEYYGIEERSTISRRTCRLAGSLTKSKD